MKNFLKIFGLILILSNLLLADAISEFFKQNRPKQGWETPDEKGRIYYKHTYVLQISNPHDPSFVKYLSLGYDEAMIDLMGEIASRKSGELAKTAILDYFRDDSSSLNKFPELIEEKKPTYNKVMGVMDKILDVVDKKLDNMLEKQGVPKEKLKKLTKEEKKLTFKNNFKNKIQIDATDYVKGFVPRKTKYAIVPTAMDEKKSITKIGIIAVKSPKTIQFARDIALQRSTMVKGKPKGSNAFLKENPKDYINEIGLRYSYDEKGKPMLVSYGMWSVTNSFDDPSIMESYVQSAIEKAQMKAESYIADYIGITVSLQKDSEDERIKKLEKAQKYIENAPKSGEYGKSGGVKDLKKEELKDTFKKYIKASSKASLRGMGQIDKWHYKDENGFLYVGSVVAWKYDNLNAIKKEELIERKIQNEEYMNQKEKKKEIKKKIVIERESSDFNSDDDF